MKDFPPELIYVLIFVGIVLVQSLMKQRASQAPQEPWEDAPVGQPPDERPPDHSGPDWGTPRGGHVSRASGGELGRPEPPAAIRARARRRFARQSLMATRRDVQNAVVIATILGPCRALEPQGEAAPPSPRRAAR